jgi:hypothetical protein
MAEHFIAEGLHYHVAGRAVIDDVSLALTKVNWLRSSAQTVREIHPAAPADRFSQTSNRALRAGGQTAA